MSTAEQLRLAEATAGLRPWKRWGPYLAERQWGTVREDYSATGDVWTYLPHDHARSRTYRWGEDGLLGVTDDTGRLALALALWNGADPILKERLFGLTGPQGNHGEDVKEVYHYLDSTPTHSWVHGSYIYPQRAYPYQQLIEANAARGFDALEFELADTGVLDEQRFFDVQVAYAKASPTDLLVRIRVTNAGPDRARLHLLPQLWYRNTWSWGRTGDLYFAKPVLASMGAGLVTADDATLGRYRWELDLGPDGRAPTLLFTENESNAERLWGVPNRTPYVKDAFHRAVIHGETGAVNPDDRGTKAAAWYLLDIDAGATAEVRLRLRQESDGTGEPFGERFAQVLAQREAEAQAWHDALTPEGASADERAILQQARGSLLTTKQFYYYDVGEWLQGDPVHPPPAGRRTGRNADWAHLNNADVLAMPDKWEYPWYAAWDLAFHAVALARLDPAFAQEQLLLMLREWYMHPNGQLPAYEFAFGDVNPPVHAWACWRVYKITAPRGQRDRTFLARCFQKLLLNFTWWVNRKDIEGNHLFSGGFLGLDNIGVFDRSRPLPTGGHLEQADGTAWMAFYSLMMLAMALELADGDPAYEDMATKFFEHFVAIADAMNTLGGTGLWNDEDGFYYDQLHLGEMNTPLRIRSMVGLIPLLACETLKDETLHRLPDFRRRLHWFLRNRQEFGRGISLFVPREGPGPKRYLLALPSRTRLERVLRYVLDEREFLSPHGVRSLSRVHRDRPFVLHVDGMEHRVDYAPGEGTTGLFGGNSNWRGPVWWPLNYLLLEALERYHHFYGETLQVPGPGGLLTADGAARVIAERLTGLFAMDAAGHRPCHGGDPRYARGAPWGDRLLFHEYFHADTGRGVGASHQTGWTALVIPTLETLIRGRHHATGPSDAR